MRGSDYGNFGFGDNLSFLNIGDVVKSLRLQFEQSLLKEPIYIGDRQVKLGRTATGQGGYRYWFICPGCGLRVGKVYFTSQAIACRHCLAIKYPSSRYKGMIEYEINLMGRRD